MEFNFDIGNTNFIALVNPNKYKTFVDKNELCFVEYTCLVMPAQFEDEKVPDRYCKKFRFNIENGLYKVDIRQYYYIDNHKHYGRNDIDSKFKFIKVLKCKERECKVFWWKI